MGITMILAPGCQGPFLSHAVALTCSEMLRLSPTGKRDTPTLSVIGQKTPAGKDSPKKEPSRRGGTLQALGIVPQNNIQLRAGC